MFFFDTDKHELPHIDAAFQAALRFVLSLTESGSRGNAPPLHIPQRMPPSRPADTGRSAACARLYVTSATPISPFERPSMNRIVYFAYGSNMSQRRLRARAPSAEFLGMGVLRGHALAFHKVGYRDGSGKCDIVASENRTVYGALFMLAEAELPALDVHEGVGDGYERRATRILNERGYPIDAWTYVATRTDPSLRPYTWYKRHVLEGAREARLPLAYLHMIELTAAIEDPDAERARRELSLYG